MLYQHGIKDVAITIKNPQANAICERTHQTVGDVLRTLMHAHPPQNIQQAHNMVDTALATAMHATRAVVHKTMRVSSGALVYHRDMILDIPLVADLLHIQEN